MFEAGKKFRHLITFSSGQPTSDLTYTLKNQDSDVLVTEDVTITSGQLSYLVEIPAVENTLSKPLFEKMTLEWEYTTATQAVDGAINYIIHLPIGFPVSQEGVRSLLGVNEEELPDDEINLFQGYLGFRNLIGQTVDMSTIAESGDFSSYNVSRAIEATTALLLLASLQIRLPRKYDSGTSAYERWNNIDWEALAASLNAIVGLGVETIEPDFEYYDNTAIFILSDHGPDAVTGA